MSAEDTDGTEHGGLFGRGSDGMPPWVPRLIIQVVVVVIGLSLTFVVLRALRGFLILLLISFFLSTAFEPGVAYLARRGWRRGSATGLIFVVAAVLTLGFVGLMIPLLVTQVGELLDDLPGYAEQLGDVAERLGLDLTGEALADRVSNVDTSLDGLFGGVAGSVLGFGGRVITTVFQLLTIGLFTFYITADAPKLRRAVLSVLPAHRQREVLRMLDIAIDKTGGYFYSRVLLAAVAALVGWIALSLIGVPFALPLALWVGVFSQFVPVVGTYIGGFFPVVIALLESPVTAVWVVVYVVAYQQVENYLLAPRITARTMALHPAVAFGAAIIGATLLGVAGALIALPAAATLQAFISTYLERHAVIESPLTGEGAT